MNRLSNYIVFFSALWISETHINNRLGTYNFLKNKKVTSSYNGTKWLVVPPIFCITKVFIKTKDTSSLRTKYLISLCHLRYTQSLPGTELNRYPVLLTADFPYTCTINSKCHLKDPFNKGYSTWITPPQALWN